MDSGPFTENQEKMWALQTKTHGTSHRRRMQYMLEEKVHRGCRSSQSMYQDAGRQIATQQQDGCSLAARHHNEKFREQIEVKFFLTNDFEIFDYVNGLEPGISEHSLPSR